MILPKSIDIHKAKAAERKVEIDNGIALAKQIDGLRETFAAEKKFHDEWIIRAREEQMKVSTELDEEIKSKRVVVDRLEEERKKLLQPINKEKEELKYLREETQKERYELLQDKERLKGEWEEIEIEKEKINFDIKEVSIDKSEAKKALDESIRLKSLSEKEYKSSLDYCEKVNLECEEKRRKADRLITEYEVALKTIEIREQQVSEKEAELLTRENDLARRIKNLQRASGKK